MPAADDIRFCIEATQRSLVVHPPVIIRPGRPLSTWEGHRPLTRQARRAEEGELRVWHRVEVLLPARTAAIGDRDAEALSPIAAVQARTIIELVLTVTAVVPDAQERYSSRLRVLMYYLRATCGWIMV